jgi:hypothetical protein
MNPALASIVIQPRNGKTGRCFITTNQVENRSLHLIAKERALDKLIAGGHRLFGTCLF